MINNVGAWLRRSHNQAPTFKLYVSVILKQFISYLKFVNHIYNQIMKVVSLSSLKKQKVEMPGAEKAWKQVPLSKDDGAPVYAYRVFTVEPDGFTPYHRHDYEHMNFVIEGEGVLVNELGEQKPLKEGDFAMVMPGEKHQYRNTSPDKPFVMICGVPKEFE